MNDDDDDIGQTEYWAERVKRVKERDMAIFSFIYDGWKRGVIKKEARGAYSLAGIKVMQEAGIIEPQWSGEYVGDAVLCTVLVQAQHAGLKAFLDIHPELKEELESRFPQLDQGRGR